MSAALTRCAGVDDLRALAARRLPRFLFDFLDGAAGLERTAAANQDTFASMLLQPRVLAGDVQPDASVALAGRVSALPMVLAPVAFAGLLHVGQEQAAARAAASAGVPMCLAMASIASMEEVRSAAPEAELYMQLYMLRNRSIVEDVLERARAIDIRTLVLTVDVPMHTRRYRDLRNGFYRLPYLDARMRLDVLRHPRWAWARWLAGKPRFGTVARYTQDGGADFFLRQLDPSLCWADVAWLRRRWPGPLWLKGLLDPEDAAEALAQGADALVVSNHGGRQLDGSPSAVGALARIRERTPAGVPLFVDGGVREGTDLVRLRALGADAGWIGRPWGYGLAAGGEAGVRYVLDMLGQELRIAMALLGKRRWRDIDASVLASARH
ncbi:alpha-hydroxy-acid oxidizing protein [Dyella jejuensis]|uniref:Alpha-hydroxy-acid oxidizing protein n=1 Tax=Dyella jejuensis TaxID=1432009 RepID=A0ABW8JLQ7_9GAMM